jgi:hypothetical protein
MVFQQLFDTHRTKIEGCEFEPWTLVSIQPWNTKEGSITVPLTSCLTGLESVVWQVTIFCFYLQNRVIQQTRKKGVNGTVILPPLVFLDPTIPILVFIDSARDALALPGSSI